MQFFLVHKQPCKMSFDKLYWQRLLAMDPMLDIMPNQLRLLLRLEIPNRHFWFLLHFDFKILFYFKYLIGYLENIHNVKASL